MTDTTKATSAGTEAPKERGRWVRPHFPGLAPMYILSDEAIEELRQHARETSEWAQKQYPGLRIIRVKELRK